MIDEVPLISICIPAYKRVESLKRLFDSISIQTFKNYEVIITDDSPDETVEKFVKMYDGIQILRYYKNESRLGTPENWNESIRKAQGEWIKLMHDDDWFSSPESLYFFSKYTNTGKRFIFSGYYSVFENAPKKLHKLSLGRKIINEPAILFAGNVIGPPSVTLVHRSIIEKYDEKLKWRVDIEFYMRILRQEKQYTYINKPLINVGMSGSQVTQSSMNNPEIELPEGWLLIQKHGIKTLKNIRVYDAWWRLLRNMNIKEEKQLLAYVNKTWPGIILGIIKDLKKTPSVFLNMGPFSKLFMGWSFFKRKSTIH